MAQPTTVIPLLAQIVATYWLSHMDSMDDVRMGLNDDHDDLDNRKPWNVFQITN